MIRISHDSEKRSKTKIDATGDGIYEKSIELTSGGVANSCLHLVKDS